MEAHNKLAISAFVVVAVGSFCLGRYALPTKTETHAVSTEVKNKVKESDTDKDNHVETTVLETVKPDGTKTKETKTVTDTVTKKAVTSSETVNTVKTLDKIVTNDRSKVTLSALAGFKPSDLTSGPSYGLHVTKAVLGPFTLGVWGLSNPGAFGLSLGLQF